MRLRRHYDPRTTVPRHLPYRAPRRGGGPSRRSPGQTYLWGRGSDPGWGHNTSQHRCPSPLPCKTFHLLRTLLFRGSEKHTWAERGPFRRTATDAGPPVDESSRNTDDHRPCPPVGDGTRLRRDTQSRSGRCSSRIFRRALGTQTTRRFQKTAKEKGPFNCFPLGIKFLTFEDCKTGITPKNWGVSDTPWDTGTTSLLPPPSPGPSVPSGPDRRTGPGGEGDTETWAGERHKLV